MGCLKLTYYESDSFQKVAPSDLKISVKGCAGGYRYGFGGQEKDDEVSGKGNSYTAEFWQYSPRLGQRWNIDPMTAKYPWQSPYATFNNNPLRFTDKFGLEGQDWIGKKDGDGNTNWKWDANVTSKDQLPSGYTEFAKPGHTYSSGGENVKLGDNGKWNYTSSSITNQGLPIDNDYTEQKLEAQRFHEQNEGYSKFLQNALTNYAFGVATLPLQGANAIARSTTALISGGANLGAQLLANKGDWSKVDVISVGISAGSGFVSGKPVLTAVTAAGVDAAVDYSQDGKLKVLRGPGKLNKNYKTVVNDFVWGTAGNLGANSFGNDHLLFQAIGTGVTVVPTTGLSIIINSEIEKK